LSIRDKAGKVVGAAQKTVSSPGEAIWKGLGTGKSAAPPPPYSPVEELRDEFGFKCWNREVRFSQTGFPASIKSGDIELLKAQVELLTLIAGKAVLWKPERKRLLESDANHLVWLTESSSELGKLYVRITAEYDGMIRYDLKLDSGTNKTVDEMSLVLPLNRRQCSLWHIPKGWQEGVYTDLSAWSQGGMENPAGLSGKSRSAEYDLPWQYYVWTGNESAGLAAIMESEKAWSRTGRKDAVKMTARNNDILEIKWLFFKEKSEIPSQWEFTFGIQATPVKPLASRAWRHRGKYSMESASPNPNFHIYWTQPQLNPYFGYPASQRPSDYKAEVEKYKEKGVGLVPYVLLTQMATNAPEYEFHFKRLTPGGAKAATPSDTAVFGADAATVPVTASDDYIDFITWKTDNFVREYDLLGTYHDLSVAYPSDVSGLGYGFTRDGKRQKDISVFRTRELYKRMYTALKNIELETGKPRLMINHMAPVSWLAAYCDLFWWGEGHKDSYLRSLTANEMCFTYGGNLGARCLWLPQPTAADGVGDPSRKDLKGRSLVNYPVKSTQYLLTLLGLHDIIFTAIDCSPEAVSRYYKIMDSFGNIGEAVFLPYWKTREIIKGQTPEKLLCSAYIQKDNNEGCMLFIGNLTDGRIESSFVIDPSKLNAKRDASLINIETGVKLLRDEGGAYKLNVEPRDYLALKLK
jgi:hypothetical protein